MFIENKIDLYEPEIAKILASLCYHIHPDIVATIQERNIKERAYFENLFAGRIEAKPYLFGGSSCVFPGIRRYTAARGKKQAFNVGESAILDDNIFPRHLWCFLLNETAYSSKAWKQAGLDRFELAHVFSHKPLEAELERQYFHQFSTEVPPYGNFTCAANVTLLPKGTVRPTDNSPTIKSVFFKRHIDLYGEDTLAGRAGFKHDSAPEWYNQLEWNDPILPQNWRDRTEELLNRRTKRITDILNRDLESETELSVDDNLLRSA